MNPKNADTHFNLAITYRNMGNIKEAKEEYEKAVELNPKYESKKIF